MTTSAGTFLGPFGYGGGFGYQETATGLKLLGHRYYDSSTGRFLTRDPVKDGRNWYVYCDNDPVGFTDPTGLKISIVGFGKPDKKQIRDQIHQIGGSDPVLVQIIYDLINDKDDHKIRPLPTGSEIGPHYDPNTDTVYVDPDEDMTLPGRGKGKKDLPTPAKVILCHELGHMWGEEDPDDGEVAKPGDNVHDVENRFRKWLGTPVRAIY